MPFWRAFKAFAKISSKRAAPRVVFFAAKVLLEKV